MRCLQIDLARQKETVEYVKSFADFAVQNGYNALILYLENAVRTEDTHFFSYEDTYSSEEIREIVDYAEGLGLDVIPALENLDHLEKFFCYPQLQGFSEIKSKSEGRGFTPFEYGSCGCISNPDLHKFMDKYIIDVCSLFNSKYVHAGLDEPFDLAVCPTCKAAAKQIGKAQLFLDHILHTHQLVTSMGKTMMMWDDFFEYADIVEELPRDIILCNWNYVFMDDQPQGHWINRIKKDWFKLYDQLGFQYMFCTYAHRASSTYNVETFTNYASKYNPIGAIMTTWRRSDSFYQGAYPSIAYAGALWGGKCDDKVKVYSELLDNEEAAKLVLSLNIVECGNNTNVQNVCEGDYMLKLMYRDLLQYNLTQLEKYVNSSKGLAYDILLDIYDYILEIYLNLSIQKLGLEVFDNYIYKNKDKQYFLDKITFLEEGFNKLKANADYLWGKYRPKIKSCFNAFENKYKNIFAKINELKASLDNQDKGVLYADMMLYDPYPTVRTKIRIKYQGEEETVLFDGVTKPTTALFETGGCYNYRFATKNKAIDYIIFGVSGEGALYPLHFRYCFEGNKYVVATAEPVRGYVEKCENLLFEDTRFAQLGIDDGIAHFNDIELSKEMHEVKITFKPLA